MWYTGFIIKYQTVTLKLKTEHFDSESFYLHSKIFTIWFLKELFGFLEKISLWIKQVGHFSLSWMVLINKQSDLKIAE